VPLIILLFGRAHARSYLQTNDDRRCWASVMLLVGREVKMEIPAACPAIAWMATVREASAGAKATIWGGSTSGSYPYTTAVQRNLLSSWTFKLPPVEWPREL